MRRPQKIKEAEDTQKQRDGKQRDWLL